MKKVLIGLVVLLVGGIVILSMMGGSVREIKTEVQISAPVDLVWSVLSAFESWTEWNPTVSLAEGKFSVGSKLNMGLKYLRVNVSRVYTSI